MMKHLLLVLALSAGLSASAQTRQIARSVPEACGIPSEAVARFFDSLMVIPRTSIHSVMILRHDKVVAEMYPRPFRDAYPQRCTAVPRRLSAPPWAFSWAKAA